MLYCKGKKEVAHGKAGKTMMKKEDLKLTREWDKTFPKSGKVDHSKVISTSAIWRRPTSRVNANGYFDSEDSEEARYQKKRRCAHKDLKT